MPQTPKIVETYTVRSHLPYRMLLFSPQCILPEIFLTYINTTYMCSFIKKPTLNVVLYITFFFHLTYHKDLSTVAHCYYTVT